MAETEMRHLCGVVTVLMGIVIAGCTGDRPSQPSDEGHIWLVKADGSGEVPDIQTAIDNATNGDLVLVLPGIYTGDGNRDIDVSGKALQIESMTGPKATIIDCQHLGRGFRVSYQESAGTILSGFTIRNGEAEFGGGIYCSETSLVIENLIVTNNRAAHGGGVFVKLSSVSFDETAIQENEVKSTLGHSKIASGGGIAAWNADVLLKDCIISGNDGEWGGGVFHTRRKLVIEGCVITGNLSASGGGLLILYGGSGEIVRTTIAANRGSGIVSGEIVLEASIVWNNWRSLHEGAEEIVFGTSTVTVRSSAVNLSGVYSVGDGDLVLTGWLVVEEPGFCDLPSFSEVPTTSGDFRLKPDSPCLPGNNLMGQQIGALGLGCR